MRRRLGDEVSADVLRPAMRRRCFLSEVRAGSTTALPGASPYVDPLPAPTSTVTMKRLTGGGVFLRRPFIVHPGAHTFHTTA